MTGLHALTPRAPKDNGQRALTACPKDGRIGEAGCPTPDTPRGGTRLSPKGAFVPPPERATPIRTSLRYGFGDGSPRQHPPARPRKTGNGPRPLAPRTGGRRRDCAQPRAPVMEARAPPPPPGAPSCHLHIAQCQLARARAVKLVTGPHARTPRAHGKTGSWSRLHAPRTGGRGRASAQPRTPHTEARGAPLRAPLGRPHSAPS